MSISEISKEKIDLASNQIRKLQQKIGYDTRDYPIAFLVENYKNNIFIKPKYQRNASVWSPEYKCRFIESLILGYPIPMLFFADNKNGKLEIIDGLQRISTLFEYLENKFSLNSLKTLTELNGFKMSDLPQNESLRLKNSALRVIVLKANTTETTRIDLFNRINTSSLQANPSELRTGKSDGPLMDLIKDLSQTETFLNLIDLSDRKMLRKENLEFASRFFAYSHEYLNFGHSVQEFVDNFFDSYNKIYNSNLNSELTLEFNKTFQFIEKNYPKNIFKNKRNQTPRVRFEALSVGTNLALKKEENLNINSNDISELVNDEEFKRLTTSDASNSKAKVKSRINFVTSYLLKRSKENGEK